MPSVVRFRLLIYVQAHRTLIKQRIFTTTRHRRQPTHIQLEAEPQQTQAQRDTTSSWATPNTCRRCVLLPHQSLSPSRMERPYNRSRKDTSTNLPHLTRPERLVHIFADEDLSEFSLLSIGQLCDGDCTAHYDKDRVWITDNKTGNTFIQGARDSDTGLYMISLDTMPPGDGSHVPSTSHTTHIAAPMTSAALRSAPVAQRVAYWSASMGGRTGHRHIGARHDKMGTVFPRHDAQRLQALSTTLHRNRQGTHAYATQGHSTDELRTCITCYHHSRHGRRHDGQH